MKAIIISLCICDPLLEITLPDQWVSEWAGRSLKLRRIAFAKGSQTHSRIEMKVNYSNESLSFIVNALERLTTDINHASRQPDRRKTAPTIKKKASTLHLNPRNIPQWKTSERSEISRSDFGKLIFRTWHRRADDIELKEKLHEKY